MTHASTASTCTEPWLPADDALRRELHDEVHARPPERIALPALIIYIAVLHDEVTRDDELKHLQSLPGQSTLTLPDLAGNFLRLELPQGQLRWERHSEFSRYTLVQPWPQGDDAMTPRIERIARIARIAPRALDAAWLRAIPGRCVAAIELLLLHGDMGDADALLARGRQWFDEVSLVASVMGDGGLAGEVGRGHSCAVTDFKLRDDGFERILVLVPAQTSASRAGRISQRLLELETYRVMALRGLPAAKALGGMLGQAEAQLADITAHMEGPGSSDPELLATLIALAARVERATAENGYRFSATQAYDTLVRQRIDELRERAIPGTQTIGAFMQRRQWPAMATVAATAARLAALSQRIERAGALLRTRVDIAAELQNQQLLAKLTRGQELQLRLQSTVEGLSIAAISYYVVSLLLYGAKAAKAAGLPIEPELAVGVLIPVVLWAVWRATRHVHRRLMARGGDANDDANDAPTSRTR